MAPITFIKLEYEKNNTLYIHLKKKKCLAYFIMFGIFDDPKKSCF